MKDFNKHLNVSQINLLKFNGESVIHSPDFKEFLISHKIKFINTIQNAHTSLCLIYKLFRTIRDIVYNLNIDTILTKNQMNIILNY